MVTGQHTGMGTSAHEVVQVDIDERIGTIRLNRPEAHNALSNEVLRALPRAIEELEADDSVDVLVITGADPSFCAGLDLRQLSAGELDTRTTDGKGTPSRYRGALPPHTKPLIGAINGAAVTGGLEIALNCDFLIASERARFADTHARVGVMPGWGLSVMLPQAVGVRRARQMSLTGNYVDAATALAWGLVNEVVPHADLMARTRALASDMAHNDQDAVRELRSIYHDVTSTTVDEGWDIESARSRGWKNRSTPDRVQAVIDRGRSQPR